MKFRSENLTEMEEKVVVNLLDGHQNLLTVLVLGPCRVLDLLPLPLKDLFESQHDEKWQDIQDLDRHLIPIIRKRLITYLP